MDGDGGDAGDMGGMDVAGGAGMNRTDGDSTTTTDSADSVLTSMGYNVDDEVEIDRKDGDSTSSGTSLRKSIIITAVVVLLGLCFLFFLIGGILAMFGVQL